MIRAVRFLVGNCGELRFHQAKGLNYLAPTTES